MYKYNLITITIILVFCAVMNGCTGQQTRARSSVIDYLYPNQSDTNIKPSRPVLNIPLKVGIAFVPEQPARSRGFNVWAGQVRGGALTEADKSQLLEKVADNFRKHKFVSEIEVIPSAYLTPRGSFANLDQIKTMYGIDIIALVSYDQVQFTDEGALSITYWTIVGAYVISGELNDTSTMLDTAVYDIKSRKMLFRAPGTSNITGSATPVNLSEELRKDSIKGFQLAAEQMVDNLQIQLDKFKTTIKSNPEKAKIVYSKGYTGGGSIGLFDLLVLFVFLPFVVSNRIITNVRAHHVNDKRK